MLQKIAKHSAMVAMTDAGITPKKMKRSNLSIPQAWP
jgi:hypothetical protein